MLIDSQPGRGTRIKSNCRRRRPVWRRFPDGAFPNRRHLQPHARSKNASDRQEWVPRPAWPYPPRSTIWSSGVYPLSTLFFHEKAHKVALSLAGITDGMRVLEVATGSGEMFRRLARINATGMTCGFDLSPNMAARTQRLARRRLPRRAPTARPSTPAICRSAMAPSTPLSAAIFSN